MYSEPKYQKMKKVRIVDWKALGYFLLLICYVIGLGYLGAKVGYAHPGSDIKPIGGAIMAAFVFIAVGTVGFGFVITLVLALAESIWKGLLTKEIEVPDEEPDHDNFRC